MDDMTNNSTSTMDDAMGMSMDMDMSSRVMNLEMRLPSLLSIISALAVIITYLRFVSLQKKRYVELVFYVAINDLFGSFGMLIGDVRENKPGCWIQGLTINYNFLSSIFWNTVIAYQVYIIIVHKKSINNLVPFHVVCWGLPLLLTLLPLTTNTYGEDDDGAGWCFISSRKNSPPDGVLLWELLAFFAWLWAAILIITILYLRAFQHLRGMGNAEVMPVVRQLESIKLYPIMLVLCWLAPTYVLLDTAVNNESSATVLGGTTVMGLAMVLPACQGLFLGCIFFYQNKGVRDMWREKTGLGPRLPAAEARDVTSSANATTNIPGDGGDGDGVGSSAEGGGGSMDDGPHAHGRFMSILRSISGLKRQRGVPTQTSVGAFRANSFFRRSMATEDTCELPNPCSNSNSDSLFSAPSILRETCTEDCNSVL